MKALLWDALRALRSRKGGTLVAMGGLALAQAACLLLALLAIGLSDPDPGIPDPERVVILDFKVNPPGTPNDWSTASPVSFAGMLKERHVPLDLISRTSEDTLTVRMQDSLQLVRLLVVDPDFPQLMGIQPLFGDLHATLAQHDGIAITPSLVRKLWGELPPEQALGRSFASHDKVYTVSAIIRNPDPRNPQNGHETMVGYESQGNFKSAENLQGIHEVNGRVYARLRPGVSIDQVGGWMREAFMANPLYAQLPADWKVGPEGPREAAYFRGLALTELPFQGDAVVRWYMLGAVGAASTLLLVLAVFNTMNLQAANLLQRQRETALRRSLGANDLQLLLLWSTEALLPLLLSAACALLLAWWAAPAFANWLDLPPGYPLADPLPLRAVAGLFVCTLAVLPLTLALPAWGALRQTPAPALQGRTASEGPWGRRVRQVLLTLQLGGALLLLAMSGILALQYQHLLRADRGFETHNRMVLSAMVEPNYVPKMDAFVAAIAHHPAIQHWAFSNARPAMDTGGPSELHVSATQQHHMLRMTVVSPGYFDTYGMKLLAGRAQTGSGEARLVIDAKAARLLGFANPQAAIGEILRGGGDLFKQGTELRRVVAVVNDIKQESAREVAQPQAFLLTDEPQWDLSVYGPDQVALRQALEDIWKQYGPPLLHRVWTADEQRALVYQQENQLTWVLTAVALLAVGVAMLGAYALVADTLRRRRTELVLHRLHGAGNVDIARQVAGEFVTPLLIAAAMGLPLAAWLGNMYLDGFVERINVGAGLALPLAIAAMVTLLVTAVAALRHVQLALTLQPIEALR